MTSAFRATFSSIRHVQGRKCYQLVMEVPQEQIDEALAVLGGMPKSDDPVWCAIARLNGVGHDGGSPSTPAPAPAAASVVMTDAAPSGQALACAPQLATGPAHTGDFPASPAPSASAAADGASTRRRFADLRPSQQAGILCNDERFRDWLGIGSHHEDWRERAAAFVRIECGLASRSELDTHPNARSQWDEMVRRYRIDTGQETEDRS